MMLESTFHAVHSSFHAVLGVAEHFTKMRLQVSQVLSALSAFRMIKYLYAKFLYLFGLASNNPASADSVVSFAPADPGLKTFIKLCLLNSLSRLGTVPVRAGCEAVSALAHRDVPWPGVCGALHHLEASQSPGVSCAGVDHTNSILLTCQFLLLFIILN